MEKLNFDDNINYLDIVNAFSRLSYKSIYIINYEKKSFEYVSDNPLFLCGYTAKKVKKMGYTFYFKHIPNEELKLLFKINEAAKSFYTKIPVEDIINYTICYDFHIINEKHKKILVSQKLTPISIDKNGKVYRAMCLVALSPNKSAGNITISKQGEENLWKFNLSSNSWEKEEKVKLSEREIQILEFSARGLTINEISEKIFLSADTVKFHRKKIFDKINVQSIAKALSYAKINKLI